MKIEGGKESGKRPLTKKESSAGKVRGTAIDLTIASTLQKEKS